MATATIISYGNVTSGNRISELGRADSTPVYIDPETVRPVEYTVYLHTISRRAFMQPHPIYRTVMVPACPAGKRSHSFMQVQHPVHMPQLNPDDVNGMPITRFENAKRVALSICNPNYRGTDLSIQDKEVDLYEVIASGECNLTRQGVFASMNAVPTEEELRKAEAKREAYYRALLEDGDKIAKSRPDKLYELLTEDHRMAADYFGIETTWHLQPKAKTDCPNCGAKIPQGVGFHYDNGRVCVLDWERAWLAGAVKKEDVPEPKQWWKETKQAAQPTKVELQAKANAMGIDVDARWSVETLLAKIAEAQEA